MLAICVTAMIASGVVLGDFVTDLGQQDTDIVSPLSVVVEVKDILSDKQGTVGEDSGAGWNQNQWMKDVTTAECIQLAEPEVHTYCNNRTEAICNGNMRDWFCDMAAPHNENCDDCDTCGGEIGKCRVIVSNSPDVLTPAKCCVWDPDTNGGECTYTDGNECTSS